MGTKTRTTGNIYVIKTKDVTIHISKVGVINGDKMITSKVQEYEYVVLLKSKCIVIPDTVRY